MTRTPVTSPEDDTNERRRSLFWLLGIAAVTVFLWQIPYGGLVVYPFTILATWFHEMGHGLTAAVLGGDFEKLSLYPDGSGVAHYDGEIALGPLGAALVAAGGPLGPSFVGAVLLLASRKPMTAHLALLATGIALLASDLLVVRTLFGIVAVLGLGCALLTLAARASERVQIFTVQLIAVQAFASMYQSLGYLFSSGAVIGGNAMDSDTEQIARALLLPYWVWGALLSAVSMALLIVGLRAAYGGRTRKKRLWRSFMPDYDQLPLFPLHTVLYPGVTLPLQIFEPRYRLMIRRCLEQNEPFGVVLLQSGTEVEGRSDWEPTLSSVGTAARITRCETIDEERYYIEAQGETRFIIDETFSHEPYLIGRVRPFWEQAAEPLDMQALYDQVATLFRAYVSALLTDANRHLSNFQLPQDPLLLSFAVAAAIQVGLTQKQQLLEITDTRERLEYEVALLQSERENQKMLAGTEMEGDWAQSVTPLESSMIGQFISRN